MPRGPVTTTLRATSLLLLTPRTTFTHFGDSLKGRKNIYKKHKRICTLTCQLSARHSCHQFCSQLLFLAQNVPSSEVTLTIVVLHKNVDCAVAKRSSVLKNSLHRRLVCGHNMLAQEHLRLNA
uniref:Uncharacterized protein n=1 Tax=Rhipicephalus microplus TaxID=6941 RepID=A0A6G5A1E3_RHIMP